MPELEVNVNWQNFMQDNIKLHKAYWL